MLEKALQDSCHKLNVAHQKYEKNRKRMGIAVIIFISSIVVLSILMPEDKLYSDVPEISYPLGIIIFASLIVAAYFQTKSTKTQKKGYEKYLIKLYRAYEHLQKYKKDEDDDQLQNAINDLDSVVSDLQMDWGDLEESNPSFKSLKNPIQNFITNLDLCIIPALDSEDVDVTKINNILEKIIPVMGGDDFSEIEKINQEIRDNFKEDSKEEKKLLEQIRENRNLTKILTSALIITGAGAVSYGAKIGVSADDTTFVTWWIMMSAAFVTGYLWKSK